MAAEAGEVWAHDRVDAVVVASRERQWDEVRAALDAGFPVNAAGADGRTLAHWAAWYGHLPTLTRLLALGADPDLRDFWEKTPMHYAVMNGRVKAVQALVAAGADVNALNGYCRTPLMVAAFHGQLPVARYLLSLPQTDLLAINLRGQTAELVAAQWGSDDVRVAIRREVRERP